MKFIGKLFVFVIASYFNITNAMSSNAEVLNKIALEQMTNNSEASSRMLITSHLHNFEWVVPIMLFLALFWDEISYLISKVKGEKKNEEV